MRKINKVKNLAGLLDLASVPQYQNGGETTLEVMLPEVEVYGDQLRRDMQRTGLTYDELANLNYGAQRQSQIQKREEGLKELVYNAPVTGDALSLYDIGKDVYEGNYGKAALGAGLLFVPNAVERSLKYAYNIWRNFILSSLFNPKVTQNRLDLINKSLRNREWNNFLAQINGDNYYRLQQSTKRTTTPSNREKDKFFISYATPWEEFATGSMGNLTPDGDFPEFMDYFDLHSGNKVLYEFPQKSFGELKATNSKGIYGDESVIDVGNKHRYYGNHSSGRRGFVRVMSDDQAKLLDMSPYIIGNIDRPKLSNGMYDINPYYENVYLGNQTVVTSDELNRALSKSHKEYYPTENGVQQIIYTDNYSEGGIHIKKKNRCKFTETMKRTGKTAEELKHSKNPLTRKRATFAINSRKFNHK